MEIHWWGPIPDEFIVDQVSMLGWLYDSIAEQKILLWKALLNQEERIKRSPSWSWLLVMVIA